MCSAVELLRPYDAVPGNPCWHVLRRAGISASEIAMVLGISPWGSPFSLYWAKKQGWEVESSAEMTAGRYAEPAIADWFAAEVLDSIAGRCHLRPAGLYAHGERSWQVATPDRLIALPINLNRPAVMELRALLECKYLVGGWEDWGEPGTDDVPVYYRAQCLWQLDTLGVDTVYLAAWHGAEFRCYVIRRDEKDLRVMRAAGAAFMRRMANDDPPPIDGHQATVRALKALHPSIDDRDVEVPPEFAEAYRRARALNRRAAAVVDRYEARARLMLGDAHRLMCNRRLVCSRSIYGQAGDTAELSAIDDAWPVVDRLNPGRSKSYA